MIKNFTETISVRVKRYVRENWGTPFIVGFTLLLIATATSLSIGLTDLANGAAIWAFYVLIVGIVLQLVCFLKYGEKNW